MISIDKIIIFDIKKLMSIFFVVFNVINAFGQNLLHITNPTNVNFSLRKQSVINGEIRGTAYSNSGSIFLFFKVDLVSKNDTVSVNASVKKVVIESTTLNQTRIFSSEKQEGLTSEMTAYIKKILESPISMDISAKNGEVISVDTSKAVRFLTNVKWENFFDDFASSLFNFTTVKAHRKRTLISKTKEGISQKIHYLLDSAAAGKSYFSFSGNRKINDKLVIAGSTVLRQCEFSLLGTLTVDTATHLISSKKTVYSGRGNNIIREKKMPFEIQEVVESKIDFHFE